MVSIRYAMCNRHKHLIGREELAEWLGVSPQTISNRLSRGDDLPPSFKSGNIRRWREQDISKWIEERIELTTFSTGKKF